MARIPALVAPATQELLRVEVLRTERLSPHWMRVTLGRGDIAGFTSLGYDQWFRLFLPRSTHLAGGGGDGGLERIPAKANKIFGYLKYLRIPEGVRPVMRNYTVRAYRAVGASGGAEIDVDFVLHGSGPTAGPASRWADAAAPGESVVIIDEGLRFNPARGAEKLLLVADEAGAPAVAGICAALPSSATGVALIEAPTAEDVLPFYAPPGIEVRHLVRDARRKPGSLALAELEKLPAPASDTHAFLVGEQSLPTAGRRHLVGQGLAKDRISFVGYWRVGAASPAPKSEQAQTAGGH